MSRLLKSEITELGYHGSLHKILDKAELSVNPTELFSMSKNILKSPFSQFLEVFCKDIMSELPFMKKTQGHSNMIKQM